MSMTLILWKAPVVREPDQAQALLAGWSQTGDESAFEPSADVTRFLDEIRAHYPDDPDSGADESSPWACWPIPDSDRLVDLSLRWSANDAVLKLIEDLARDFKLVLYDPQGPDMHLPDDPVDSGPIPPLTAWQWLKTFAIPAFLVALTYAAWHIPFGWLRWPAVIIVGFVALAGLFVLWLAVGSALGLIKEEAD
jgi:hypothetical protein